MIMLILMTAALVAAVPAVEPTSGADAHAQHIAVGETDQHEQTKCCDCCKDMAKKHDGHSEYPGHAAE
jgi:hypothetical protein